MIIYSFPVIYNSPPLNCSYQQQKNKQRVALYKIFLFLFNLWLDQAEFSSVFWSSIGWSFKDSNSKGTNASRACGSKIANFNSIMPKKLYKHFKF
jgi:hypothetical protein